MRSCLVLWLLVRAVRSAARLASPWRQLHRDQAGSVQALSLVLTLPVFVWLVMFIVQVSQLMIGSIVVHYAAFAAARAAVVWIPAHLEDEPENVLGGGYTLAMDVVDGQPDTPVVLDETSPSFGPRDGWLTYDRRRVSIRCSRRSRKTQKILAAAVMAMAPICPSSRDAGQHTETWNETADDVANAFLHVARSAAARPGSRVYAHEEQARVRCRAHAIARLFPASQQ